MPLFLAFLLLLAPRHAYHASIAEMRYNGPQKQLEISLKVFTDDFEKALSRGQPAPVRLAAPGPLPSARAAAYLRQQFVVKTAAGAPLGLQFLGMQAEKDSHWLYCKVTLPRTMAGLQIRHAVLLDVFADQANILNLEAGGRKQSLLFRAGHEQELVTW